METRDIKHYFSRKGEYEAIVDIIKGLLAQIGETPDSISVKYEESAREGTLAMMKLNYADEDYDIPFVVYPDGSAFMPLDWQGALPEHADGIGEIDWVSMPSKQRAVMMDGLPRILFGDM